MSWAPITHTNSTQEITAQWVKENLASGSFQLIDCREQQEWDATRIEGAILYPLSEWDSHTAKIDITKPVVVYCRSGKRSSYATNDLLAKGFTAASMKGGIPSYF